MNEHFDESDRDNRPLILIIDDDPETTALLSHMLQKEDYRTISAEAGPMGIAIAKKYKPNAIILDLDMPDMDGCAVCERLKATVSTAEIPIVFVTAAERTDEVTSRCFDAGANDFLTKPFSRVSLIARIRVVLREQAIREGYRRLAMQDAFTGLANRRQFIQDVNHAITTARREASESIVILADIDGLEQINDRFGHDFGDELILTFARLLNRAASPDCRPARIDGNAFGVVLTSASKQRGRELCERLCRIFASVVFDAQSEPKHFTVCFGLSAYGGEPPHLTADALVGQADTALYLAKQAVRNRIIAYWQLDPNVIPRVPPDKRRSRTGSRRPTERSFLGVVQGGTSDAPSMPVQQSLHRGAAAARPASERHAPGEPTR